MRIPHLHHLVVALVFLCVTCIYGLPSDQQLFDSLNLNLPQLREVKQYYAAHNIPAAKTALAQYLRARPAPAWYPNYGSVCEGNDIMSTADQVVKRTIYVLNYPYTFPNATINWAYNPTVNNPQISYSPEWQWALNRQCFWPNLGAAYADSHNTVYSQTFASQLSSWINNCPKPDFGDEKVGSEWRTIDSGIRVSYSWPDAWLRFKNAPEVTDDVLILWLKSFLDHGNYLHQWHTGGNWLTMEMNGLFSVGSFFPEFQNASAWRQFASQTLYKLMQTEFLPDGGWQELTTGYAQVSINNCAWLYFVAKTFNTTADVAPGYTDVLLRALTWDVNIMTPSGVFPLVNDAWYLLAQTEGIIGAQLFPDNKLMQWLASNRTQGEAPAWTSVFANYSGYVAMRTGWGFEDTYGFFDVAGLGAGHWHQDKLNLLIDAYGRRILYDGGGGQYNVDKWRAYATGTASHNTVIVDGLLQNRPPPSHDDPLGKGDPKTPAPLWQTSSQFDYACGYYIDKYGTINPAQHRREVVFWKEDFPFFVVVDTLTPNDAKPHTYHANWNFLSQKFYNNSDLKLVSTNDAGQPNIAIAALSSTTSIYSYIAVNTTTELLGWDISRDIPFNIPALEVVHTVTAAGKRQFVTLLLPLPANTQQQIIRIDDVNYSGTEFVVYFQDGTQIHIQLGNEIGVKVSVEK